MAVPVPYVQEHAKTGRLSFRRVYPPELRPFIDSTGASGPIELKRSLGAKSLKEPGAMLRYQAASAEYDRIVESAKRAKDQRALAAVGLYTELTPELSAFLVEAYKAELLAEDEEIRWEPRSTERKLLAAERLRKHCEDDLAEHKALRAIGDLDAIVAAWAESVAGFASSHDMVLDGRTQAFRLLCRDFNDANIAVWEATLERLRGSSVPTPEQPVRSLPVLTDATQSFEQIVQGVLDSPVFAVGYPTREGTKTALRYLREAHGPLSPHEITKAKVTEHLNLLAQKPSRVPKGERVLPLRELVELYKDRENVKRLTVKTIEQQMIFLSSMWSKAQDAGHIPETLVNPFRRKELAKGKHQSSKALFGLGDVKAIFSLDIFTEGVRPAGGKGEASYWIPLLLLWTGARPEEIAQLMVDDVRQGTDGRWALTITDEGEHPHKGSRRLKTTEKGTGRRTFLIPQGLLDLNFLGYVEHLRREEERALFPHLRTKGARGYLYAGWSEWWSKYLASKHVSLPPGARPTREFRHFWSTVARECGIPKDARAYLMGHAPQDTNDTYGRREAFGNQMDHLRFAGLEDTLGRIQPWKL